MEAKFTKDYEVTEDGLVFSVNTNWRGFGRREMVQDTNKYGYKTVRLTIDGKRKKFRVHQLVALFYLPPKPGGQYQLRHLDGNKENNSASNLAWGTAKDNADDRARHGRTSHGESHSRSLRMSNQVEAIREYWRKKRELKESALRAARGEE